MALRKRTDLIVVHVSATPPDRDIGAQEIDEMHRARGWRGIGYHYVIRRDGRVEQGRPENQVGAHVAGWNSVSLGVCLVGGVDADGRPQDSRTAAQTAALEKLLRALVGRYPGATICGHRDLSPDRDGDGAIEPHEYLKACPCFDVIPWARSVGLPAARIRGAWDTPNPPGPDDRTVYLQTLLKRAGYEFGPVDGIAGPKTRAALKRFQAAAGLPETGDFDAPTVARLRAMFEASRPEKPVVPEEVDREAERPVRRWGWLTTLLGSGGAGVGALLGAEWQTVVAFGGLALGGLIILAILGPQIAGAIRRVREAAEGRA